MLTPPLLNVTVVKPPCTPTSTLSSESDENHCWICMEPGDSTPRSVCGCKNAVAHVECIEKWVKSKPEFSMNCEVCLQPYKVGWRFEEEKDSTVVSYLQNIVPMILAVSYGILYMHFSYKISSWVAWTGNVCIVSSWLFFACISRDYPLHKKYLIKDLFTLLISYVAFLVTFLATEFILRFNDENNANARIATAHTCNAICFLCTACSRTVCVHCRTGENAL